MAKAAASGEVEAVAPESYGIESLNELFHIEDNFAPETVDDLEEYFAEHGGIIEFRGSNWTVVKKEELLSKPFTIADIRFYEGTFGDACAILLMTADNERLVINDGSTGVFQQCKFAVAKAGRRGGMYCPNGLRKSEYEYVERDFDGNPVIDPKTGEPKAPTPARTYYIA